MVNKQWLKPLHSTFLSADKISGGEPMFEAEPDPMS